MLALLDSPYFFLKLILSITLGDVLLSYAILIFLLFTPILMKYSLDLLPEAIQVSTFLANEPIIIL